MARAWRQGQGAGACACGMKRQEITPVCSEMNVAHASRGEAAWGLHGEEVEFISCGYAIRVWDVATGDVTEPLQILEGHDSVSSVTWSPDGRHLATGSKDETVRVWKVASGTLVRSIPTQCGVPVGVTSVAWSPCGSVCINRRSTSRLQRQWGRFGA